MHHEKSIHLATRETGLRTPENRNMWYKSGHLATLLITNIIIEIRFS